MGRELEVSVPGSQVVILRARWRPRGWGGGHQERQEGGGESSALDASPGEADLRDATSSPLPPDCSMALPRVWLMWPSSGDLGERQPESRGLETALAGGAQWTLLPREAQGWIITPHSPRVGADLGPSHGHQKSLL